MDSRLRTYSFWIILFAVQAVWIVNSDGFYFIDDSSHFNYNRHYLDSFGQSTGTWHRIGRVLLFAIPAQLGLKGVQIASALLFVATIFTAYKILKAKNVKYPEWVIPLIGFQPVLFNISYTTLAELPAGFLILLSYFFFIKEKPIWVIISSSLIFIFRTEYYYVAGLFFLIYAYRKNWKVLPWFFTGPVLWYLYTTIITFDPTQFFYDLTLHTRLLKIDTGVDWYYYLLHSAKIYGLLQTLFLITGSIMLWLKKQFNDYALLIIIIIAGIGIQTLLALKGLNLTCSIGQLRYIAVVGPAFGVISAAGLSFFFGSLGNNVLRNIFTFLFLFIMFVLGPYSTPFHNKFEIEKVSEDISTFAAKNYPGYKLISNMHQLANALDESQTGGKKFTLLSQGNVDRSDKALIIWCSYLEGSPFVEDDVTLNEILAIPHIKLVKDYGDTVNNCTSIPIYRKYRKEGDEYKTSRDIIDYIIADQTTWETIDIRVFLKE